jgi:DNA-binding Xre family transcriptional regulator
MFDYMKLWMILTERRMTKEALKKSAGLSTQTITDMGKGKNISGQTIARICAALGCQPGDIMEYVPDVGTERNGGSAK